MVATRRPDPVRTRRVLPARSSSDRSPHDDSSRRHGTRRRSRARTETPGCRAGRRMAARSSIGPPMGRRVACGFSMSPRRRLACSIQVRLTTRSRPGRLAATGSRSPANVMATTRSTGSRPDGTQLQRLTRLPGPDAHPSFSPDGEWIAFATGSQGFKDEAMGLVIGALPPQFQAYGEIAVMRSDGSDLRSVDRRFNRARDAGVDSRSRQTPVLRLRPNASTSGPIRRFRQTVRPASWHGRRCVIKLTLWRTR